MVFRSPSRRLTAAIAGMLLAPTLVSAIAVYEMRGGPAQTWRAALPSVTLVSGNQNNNRIAIDTHGLGPDRTVTVPVVINNAGNKAIDDVLANLVSPIPGVELTVQRSAITAPDIAPRTSAEYQVQVKMTDEAADINPQQVVVAFSPKF